MNLSGFRLKIQGQILKINYWLPNLEGIAVPTMHLKPRDASAWLWVLTDKGILSKKNHKIHGPAEIRTQDLRRVKATS